MPEIIFTGDLICRPSMTEKQIKNTTFSLKNRFFTPQRRFYGRKP